MNLNKKIKSLLQEAEIYRSQGLLNEAEKKYRSIEELLRANNQINNREKLLEAISKKIFSLGKDIEKVINAPKSPGMSEEVQDLIKNLFSFSKEKDKDASALEGAIALAKFGQFERALKEFNALMEKNTLRVVAAKNIIRCHLILSSIDDAIDQFMEWQRGDLFSFEQLEKVRLFLESILDKKGIKKNIAPAVDPTITMETPAGGKYQDEDDDILDISAIAITPRKGSQKGEPIELDVSFQTGNVINIIISKNEKGLLDNLNVGDKLDDIHFFSPIAIFRGTGIVAEKAPINSGPKQGDYNLDIRIEGL